MQTFKRKKEALNKYGIRISEMLHIRLTVIIDTDVSFTNNTN